MGLKIKDFNIFVVHRKFQYLGGYEKPTYKEGIV